MKLDDRMSAILTEIPPNLNVADIGADHGYIGISYAMQNPRNIVVGSDISAKSIQKAEQTAHKLGLKNYFTSVGDGLKPTQNYAIDVVLISGMGGEEMINIISSSKKYPKYVLSPQKNVDKVRKFLSEQNLVPQKDYKVLSEGKFYDVIVAVEGEYSPSQFELLYGSGKGKDFPLYAEQTKKYYNELLKIVGNEDSRQNILSALQLLNSKIIE